ncbi:MAG: FixH family protein [Pseudomonadota bacterium]
MTKTTHPKQFTGWHALTWLIGFFAVMFAANGIFLYHAITSFPGEDSPKSYVQGLNYNKVLGERTAQAERAWTAELGIDGKDLVFRISDKDGQPIGWRRVGLLMRRPATTSSDTAIIMSPGNRGEYRADATNFDAGEWEAVVSVFAIGDDKVDFVAHKTLSLP